MKLFCHPNWQGLLIYLSTFTIQASSWRIPPFFSLGFFTLVIEVNSLLKFLELSWGKKNIKKICYEHFFSNPSPKTNLEILSTPQRYFPLGHLYSLRALDIQALGRQFNNNIKQQISRTFGIVEELILKIFLKIIVGMVKVLLTLIYT